MARRGRGNAQVPFLCPEQRKVRSLTRSNGGASPPTPRSPVPGQSRPGPREPSRRNGPPTRRIDPGRPPLPPDPTARSRGNRTGTPGTDRRAVLLGRVSTSDTRKGRADREGDPRAAEPGESTGPAPGGGAPARLDRGPGGPSPRSLGLGYGRGGRGPAADPRTLPEGEGGRPHGVVPRPSRPRRDRGGVPVPATAREGPRCRFLVATGAVPKHHRRPAAARAPCLVARMGRPVGVAASVRSAQGERLGEAQPCPAGGGGRARWGRGKLPTLEDEAQIRKLVAGGTSHRDVRREVGFSISTISKIIRSSAPA